MLGHLKLNRDWMVQEDNDLTVNIKRKEIGVLERPSHKPTEML